MLARRILALLCLIAISAAMPLPFAGTAAKAITAAASRDPVRGKHGMVASTNALASQAGVEIMRRGGNAVDAAVAVAFALAVTHPAAGNIGGGGFMMIRLHDGTSTAVDYREMDPAAATHDVYLDAQGNLIKGEGSSTVGYRAAGVPGTVAGMGLALKKYGSGKLTWAEVIEPARRLAAEGFPLTEKYAQALRNEKSLEKYEDSRRIFLNNGQLYKEGDLLRQPELATTFGRLQKGGPKEFYEGETARLIAADMARHAGLITLEDFHGYAARERQPLRSTYRGHEILSMPPPSSGGAVLIEMLNILEGYEMGKMGWSSSERDHVMVEAMRRAFADRAAYMGDSDFVSVPVNGMIDKGYAARLRNTIDLARASTSADIQAGKPVGYESEETTHFTVIDNDGNAVSNTYTLNLGFGSGVVAKGTGILLNDQMDDFAAKPGVPNSFGLIQGERNAVAPRKRPLSAMTPVFVLRKDGQLWFAVGSPGGPTIINTVLQVVTNVIDYGMNLQAAIDSPRIHHQWLPDEITHEPYGISSDTMKILQARGHKFSATPRYMGDAEGVMIEEGTGVRLGASDPRGEGASIGY